MKRIFFITISRLIEAMPMKLLFGLILNRIIVYLFVFCRLLPPTFVIAVDSSGIGNLRTLRHRRFYENHLPHP